MTSDGFSKTRFDLLRDERRPSAPLETEEIKVDSNEAEKWQTKQSNTPSSFYLETVEIISKVNSHVNKIKQHLLDKRLSDQPEEKVIFPEQITIEIED
jgi:hypothetical protein